MGMREFEAGILRELRTVAKKPKLRQKDILAWSTGDVEVGEGKRHYYLPEMGVNVVIAEAK